MIGPVDSLLFKINGKFRLGIPIDRVEIDNVQWSICRDYKNRIVGWIRYGKSTWKLVLDDKATKKLFVARFFNFITDSWISTRFKTRIRIIPYFEQSLNQLMKLIDYTKMKEYRPRNGNKTWSKTSKQKWTSFQQLPDQIFSPFSLHSDIVNEVLSWMQTLLFVASGTAV